MEDKRDTAADCESPSIRPTSLNQVRALAGAKQAVVENRSYIENCPEKSVVLSPRLERLIVEVGGCQTEQVKAVVQRIMYELLSR